MTWSLVNDKQVGVLIKYWTRGKPFCSWWPVWNVLTFFFPAHFSFLHTPHSFEFSVLLFYVKFVIHRKRCYISTDMYFENLSINCTNVSAVFVLASLPGCQCHSAHAHVIMRKRLVGGTAKTFPCVTPFPHLHSYPPGLCLIYHPHCLSQQTQSDSCSTSPAKCPTHHHELPNQRRQTRGWRNSLPRWTWEDQHQRKLGKQNWIHPHCDGSHYWARQCLEVSLLVL